MREKNPLSQTPVRICHKLNTFPGKHFPGDSCGRHWLPHQCPGNAGSKRNASVITVYTITVF